MLKKSQGFVLAGLLMGVALAPMRPAPAEAAEREDVRKVINLVTAVKMPYPEQLTRSRAKTERVWLERLGTTAGCIRMDSWRWCYEHIPPDGNRAEMLRIRKEPTRGIVIGELFHYVADFDLDGLIDLGSTTKIDALEQRRPFTPIADVIKFYHRSTKRGDEYAGEYQKMYDEGIQIALKYFGE